jgi:anti-anti-sigma factor
MQSREFSSTQVLSPVPVKIEVRHREGPDGVAVVAVVGAIDAADDKVDRLRVALDEVLASDAQYVLIDLTEATAVISRAFGQMLVTLSRLRTRGGDLRLAGARGSVLKAAQTVGLDDIVQLHETTAEGIASFERT